MSGNNLIFPLLIPILIFRNKNSVFFLSSAQLGYKEEVKDEKRYISVKLLGTKYSRGALPALLNRITSDMHFVILVLCAIFYNV